VIRTQSYYYDKAEKITFNTFALPTLDVFVLLLALTHVEKHFSIHLDVIPKAAHALFVLNGNTRCLMPFDILLRLVPNTVSASAWILPTFSLAFARLS